MPKVRIDQHLVDLGLASSRAAAQALLLSGKVMVDGKRVDKAGTLVAAEAVPEVHAEEHPYVSRGGVKLEGALRDFGIDVKGLLCLDVGASTGGFTDCLLRHGAARVIAVDVGYGQLAHKLRVDPRVTVLERTNARTLTAGTLGGQVDLTVVDASFISLAKLVGALADCTRGELLALIKPQFEVGREEASRGKGVIRDPSVRLGAIETACADVAAAGFKVEGVVDCRLPGPKGNLEAFVRATKVPRRQPPG